MDEIAARKYLRAFVKDLAPMPVGERLKVLAEIMEGVMERLDDVEKVTRELE